jgi:hypothetical protein
MHFVKLLPVMFVSLTMLPLLVMAFVMMTVLLFSPLGSAWLPPVGPQLSLTPRSMIASAGPAVISLGAIFVSLMSMLLKVLVIMMMLHFTWIGTAVRLVKLRPLQL